MGTYTTCGTWLKLGFDCLVLGFILETVAMASDFTSGHGDQLTNAMEITGLATYVTTVYMVVQLVFLFELEDSIPAKVVTSILSFLACGFTVAGIVIQYVRHPGPNLRPFPTAMLAMAAALALLGGIFILLDVCKVKVPPSPCCKSRATSVGANSPLKADDTTKDYGGT